MHTLIILPEISAPGLFHGLSSIVSMLNSNAGTPFILPGPSRSSKVTLLPVTVPGRGFSGAPVATRPTPRYTTNNIVTIF